MTRKKQLSCIAHTQKTIGYFACHWLFYGRQTIDWLFSIVYFRTNNSEQKCIPFLKFTLL